MEKQPKPRKRIPLEPIESTKPIKIPENDWIDDKANLKKDHFEVERMLTCHCEQHFAQAVRLIDSSYIKAYGKFNEETCDLLREIYEIRIQQNRINERGLKPINIVDFNKWKDESK